MKHRAHQPDFTWGQEPFALVGETGIDHERRQREAEQRSSDLKQSSRRQAGLAFENQGDIVESR